MLLEREIARSFNKAANTYDQYSEMQQVVGQKLVAKLLNSSIQPFSIILDVGSGTGFISQLLAKSTQIISLDIAYEMLVHAKLMKCNNEKSAYICANANAIPLPDHSVDLIVSNLMLHWHTDTLPLIRELHRVLRPQGVLIFSTLGPATLYELRNSWGQVDDLIHVNKFIEPEELKNSLRITEFKNIFLEMEKLVFQYQDLNFLFKSLKKTGVHNMNTKRQNSLMGKEKFQNFLSAYKQYYQTNKQWPATYEIIYGWTQK